VKTGLAEDEACPHGPPDRSGGGGMRRKRAKLEGLILFLLPGLFLEVEQKASFIRGYAIRELDMVIQMGENRLGRR